MSSGGAFIRVTERGKDITKMINVVGLGYIGLPTALMLAAHGVEVVGTDHNAKVIDMLNGGQATYEEDGLQMLFESAVSKGISFTTEYMETDTYIIAVPTPYDKDSKKIDANYVVAAVESSLKKCKKGAVIIIESTISPGTIDRFVRPLIEEKGFVSGEDIHIVHAPERIIPGSIIHELENNSRTIGADDMFIAERVKKIYASFCKGEIVLTSIRSAEMTKVVENAYRDINIAYANELAKICRNGNMDVYEIIQIANKHPRVNILSPGPGVGGHCISVDPWFLVGDYPGLANLILSARKINDSMPEYVLERMSAIMKAHQLTDVSRVGLYGLTYKEDVDDVRESPTLQLLDNMNKHLAGGVKVYDPYVKCTIVDHQYHDFEAFLRDIDLIVIMVGHTDIKEKMNELSGKIILDTRNICDLPHVHRL